jgi:transcriptional regulator with XRE-family HTH domain
VDIVKRVEADGTRPDGRPRGPRRPDGTAAPRRREPLWRDVIGEVLRRERQAQARTLQDVADAARISMPYLSELERGRKEASSEILAAAAKALDLSLSELISLVQDRLGSYEQTFAAQAFATPGGTGAAGRDALCLAA